MAAWEQEIIREVLAGNRGAYGRLVLEYQDPIRHSVTRLLGDAETARDITQDAFLAAYENLHTYDSSRSFFSWLYRIAWNRALNCSRRDRRTSRLSDRDFPTREPSPEDRVLADERAAGLNGAIRSLPQKYLLPRLLRHYLDCSYLEIAGFLDLPATTVRSRIHTARRLLAKRLR